MSTVDEDKELITALGGPAAVAELLLFKKEGGVQRVQNWTTRGIPSAIKVAHPDIFMRTPKPEATKAEA